MADSVDKSRLAGRDIRRRFDRVAASFDSADFVHAHARDGLLTRLAPLRVDARTVIDLGAATCSAQQALGKRFARAHVISVDMSCPMLKRGRRKKSWLSKVSFVQATAVALPFPDQSIDAVFANLLLPWIDDTALMFSEVARVLRRGGVFAFSTLGPDSLQELRRAWQSVDTTVHVNHFLDMHDLGDGLVRAGLGDPVLDVDRLRVEYANSSRLFADLSASGGRNALLGRRRSLTGKHRLERMVAALEGPSADRKIALDLELVFGHCWGTGPRMDAGDYRIDAARIPLRRG